MLLNGLSFLLGTIRFVNQGKRYSNKKRQAQDLLQSAHKRSQALPSASAKILPPQSLPTDTLDSRRFSLTVNYRVAFSYF